MSHVELSDEHNFAMLKQSRMECPTERREVPGMEETQESDRVMGAAGLLLRRRLPATSSKQGSTFGTREIRWRLERRRGQDDQRQSCSAVWVSRGSCKRWRERSIGSGGATSARRSVRKYRRDAKE